MLWYVSKDKLDILTGHGPSCWPKSLAIKLKEPFTGSEVSMTQGPDTSVLRLLDNFKKRLAKSPIPCFAQLTDSSIPMLCAFEGRAARIIQDAGFWAALADESTAILLAGAASNAVGAHSIAGTTISPSASPVDAVRRAFGHGTDDMTVLRNLSYAWQAVWRSVDGAIAVPEVRGAAVVAGVYRANKAEMRRARHEEVDQLVVASPIFVEQIAR